jgi:hypothetical protein
MTMALPLGLARDPLNSVLVKQLELLENYNFWEVDTVIMRKYRWREERIKSVGYETRQYLALSLLDHECSHIPTDDVDEYWHRMILQTRFYKKFCADVFGFFQNHGPAPTNEVGRVGPVVERTCDGMEYWFGKDWRGPGNHPGECSGSGHNDEGTAMEAAVTTDGIRLLDMLPDASVRMPPDPRAKLRMALDA